MQKTNAQWHPYEEFGSFYRLEGGTLFQCPMMVDGSRDDNAGEVDFICGVEEEHVPRMTEIVHELQRLP